MTYKWLRKNGGMIWHFVRTDGAYGERGVALCGAETDKRKRRSYWTAKAGIMGNEMRKCPRCMLDRQSAIAAAGAT